jgi:hypothetical protein
MVVFEKPKSLSDDVMHIVPDVPTALYTDLWQNVSMNLVSKGKTVGIAPVGCSVFRIQLLQL